MGFRRDPADFQWQCPTSFTDALREQRQAVAKMHPRSAVHIAQLDSPSFRARIVARIQNSHAPLACRRARPGDLLRCEPTQTLLPQLLQPVIVLDRLGQLFTRTTDSGVKATPLIAPHPTERQFDRGSRARPDRQHINQVVQDPARWPKALRDAITKFWLFGNSRGERLNLVFEFGSGHIILGMSPRIPKEPEILLYLCSPSRRYCFSSCV